MTDELFNTLVSQLVPSIAALLVGLIVRSLVQAVNVFLPEILEIAKDWLGNVRYRQVVSIIRAGVMAAEQSGLRGDIENLGNSKKQWALDYIKGELIRLKLDRFIPMDTVDKLIEATVYDELGRLKMPPEFELIERDNHVGSNSA